MNEKIKEIHKEEEDTLTVKDLLLECRRYWKWWLLSVVIGLSVALFLALRSTPQYTRTAAVQIKDDNGGSSLGGGFDKGFGGLSLLGQSSNVQNEIIAFNSPALMQKVVKRLGLQVTYAKRGVFRDPVLYGDKVPYHAVFEESENPIYGSFEVKVLDNGRLSLSHFTWWKNNKKYKVKEAQVCMLNKPVKTPIGVVTMVKNPKYKGQAFTETLLVDYDTPYGALQNFFAEVNVTLRDKLADVIDLQCVDPSEERATDILNTMINIYNENWVAEKNQMVEATDHFIKERLLAIQKDLGKVDDNISSYRSKHLLVDMKEMATLHLHTNARNAEQVLLLNNQLYMANYVRQQLRDDKKAYDLLPLNTGAGNAALEGQIVAYNEKVLERNQLVANSSDKNPIAMEMDKNLVRMRKAVLEAVNTQINTLQAHIASLQTDEKKNNTQLAEGPQQAKYLLSVERQQKVKEALYIYLLEKREETKLSQTFTAYNTRIITPPMGANYPKSKKMMIMVLGLFIGGLLPVVIIYMREMSNTKVRGRKDLNRLTIPILGDLPFYNPTHKYWKRKKLEEGRVMVEADNRNIINEAFRVLRSNLEFLMRSDSKKNVFVTTSFNPESGKSFIVMNLAIALAIQKKRVLLIDGDMRHASLSMYVRSPRNGLSNYLAGYVDNVKDITVQYEGYDTLHVIPCGIVPPNPTEILEGDAMEHLLEQVKKDYDYVIVDCPPVDIVADATLIERYADRTLFVVRVGRLERSMLPILQRKYEEKEYKEMTVILNGTDYDSRHSYNYGYHNYYHKK